MSAPELEFASPETVEEALGLLSGNEDGLVMAGGTSVVMMLKNGLVAPRRLVWLGRVDELRGIHVSGDGSTTVGSLTTLRELASCAEVARRYPGLADAASSVGNERIRSVATIGGSVLHADPRQDVPPVLLALDAQAVMRRPGGSRELPLRKLYTGFLETALDGDEILTHVRLPPARARSVVYMRFTPGSSEDYPTVGVAASLSVSRRGRITDAAVAVAGAGPVPLLVAGVAEILAGSRLGSADVDAVALAAERTGRPISDRFGSADYKRAMVGVWTRRALRQCLADRRRVRHDVRPL